MSTPVLLIHDLPDETIGWISVGFCTSGAIVELWWENDWTKYPTSNLDMVIAYINDTGLHYEFVAGGSLRSPEGVKIDDPTLVGIYVLIFGYETYGTSEKWTFRVYYL